MLQKKATKTQKMRFRYIVGKNYFLKDCKGNENLKIIEKFLEKFLNKKISIEIVKEKIFPLK